jgi:nitroreductase
MEFFETVTSRCSIRSFTAKPVEKEKILKILEVANLAPSAGNLQAYRIALVSSQEIKEKLADACLGQSFIAEASFVLVFLAAQEESAEKYGDRGMEVYSFQDATIAAAYAQLAVASLGLGSTWVGAFDPLEISRIISAETYEVPTVVLPIGYPAENPNPKIRKRLSDIVREM